LLDQSVTTRATRQANHGISERRKHGAALRGSSTGVP
jgi:hypothetical protein